MPAWDQCPRLAVGLQVSEGCGTDLWLSSTAASGEVGPECLQPGGEEETDLEEILPSDPCAQASC